LRSSLRGISVDVLRSYDDLFVTLWANAMNNLNESNILSVKLIVDVEFFLAIGAIDERIAHGFRTSLIVPHDRQSQCIRPEKASISLIWAVSLWHVLENLIWTIDGL